jgi:hypothetical protein
VANQRAAAKQSGVTPGKLALIGVLAVVLVIVIYIQYGDQLKSKAASTAPASTATAPRSKSTKSKTAKADDVADADFTLRKSTGSRATWQAPELGSVVAYDPFALPASFPQPRQGEAATALAQTEAQKTQDASVQQAALAAERTQLQAALTSLKQQGVQAVITKGNQSVAIIGGQEVRVGDEYQGFTVVAIDPDSNDPDNIVRLSKDLSP